MTICLLKFSPLKRIHYHKFLSTMKIHLMMRLFFQNMGIISEIKTIPQSVTNGSVKSGDSRVKQLLTVRRFLMILFSIIIMGFVITLVVAVTYK